ncbi:MAG: hypothetical protein AB7U75_04710 [Hyphomicrobiaceae bacterium]
MSTTMFRLPMLAVASGFLLALAAGGADAADRASYLTACGKDSDKAKCACVADKVDQAFKDKKLAFAFQSLEQPIGELVNSESGLSEKEEDEIVDKTFAFMKECGLVK